MFQKKIIIFLCFSILCIGCTKHTQQNETTAQKDTLNYEQYFQNIVKENDADLQWNILLTDLNTGEVLGSYGEKNDSFEPGNIIKPALYSSFLEHGVLLENEVDISSAVYKEQNYRSRERFPEGTKATVLESFILLNQPAIVNIWRDSDYQKEIASDMSTIGVTWTEENIRPLLGYETMVNIEEITKFYAALANEKEESETPFSISPQTKQTLNDVLQKTFQEVCDLEEKNGWTPYGVFETVAYPPKEDIDTNFAGYLKNGTEGVVLLINVKSCEKPYTSEELANVVYSIFDSYTME